MNLPEKIYTEQQLQSARGRAKFVGWLQGAGVVVGAGMLWSLLGWIPMALALGGGGYLAWKIFSGSSDSDEDTE